MPVPNPVFIYRMVHWQNVEHILNHGLCCRGHENADENYINIGHEQLIEDRHEEPIDFPEAGNLGEYVPFYFAGKTPMLLKVCTGHGGVTRRPQNDIVFIVSTMALVEQHELEFVFSDMHAKRALATFYNSREDLNQLKWEYIESSTWNNTPEHLNRQDYKQAEFLVRQHMPIGCIRSIVVFSPARRDFFQNMVNNLGLNIKVVVDAQRTLYY